MITKRIYELKKGDIIRYLGVNHIVTEVSDRIYTKHGKNYERMSFGLFNQAKIEIVEPITPECPVTSYNNLPIYNYDK